MIFGNPVRGTIRPDARYYPSMPNAILRPAGSHIPLLTHDFGPSSVKQEFPYTWPGGEGIRAGYYEDFHTGIDISNDGTGYDHLAMGPGEVIFSGKNGTGAEIIRIDHGIVGVHQFETGGVHLSRRFVEVGALVTEGQVIGKTGDTGISTAPHLHAYVKKDGEYADPWRRLKQNTTIDPDAPEDDMNLATYIPGHTATMHPTIKPANIRAAANTKAKLLRQIEVGTVETRRVIGWEKGELVNGSDRWLVWWNEAPPKAEPARLEYAHSSNVDSVAPLVVDCAPLVKAATDPLNAKIAAAQAALAAE